MMKKIEKKIAKILDFDYSSTALKPGQEWYLISGRHLSLEESKVQLEYLMSYIKEALENARDMYVNFEYLLDNCAYTGNLFNDVLELGEVLSVTEMFARDFIKAYDQILIHEEPRQDLWSPCEYSEKDLPF